MTVQMTRFVVSEADVELTGTAYADNEWHIHAPETRSRAFSRDAFVYGGIDEAIAAAEALCRAVRVYLDAVEAAEAVLLAVVTTVREATTEPAEDAIARADAQRGTVEAQVSGE